MHDLVIFPQIVSKLKRVLKDKFGLPRQLVLRRHPTRHRLITPFTLKTPIVERLLNALPGRCN